MNEQSYQPKATSPSGEVIVYRDGAWRNRNGVPVDSMGRPTQ